MDGALLLQKEQNQNTVDGNDERSVANLVRRLCTELERGNVTYCHWKSNAALDKSAAGTNDLDLLVGRRDALRFIEILHRLGFKQAEAPSGNRMPGVQDFFGYDSALDRFIHVHAHFQLILGHDMTKNFRVPLEEQFLSSATRCGLFKVPAPELEYIVLVIRMTLKHSSWDSILGRQGQLKESARQELAFLRSRMNPELVDRILEDHVSYLSGGLFRGCVESLEPRCSIWKRVTAAHRLEKRLAPHARHGWVVDTYLRVWRRVRFAVQRRIVRGKPKYRLAGGGAMIAILGGDGAGKTTAIESLYTWLSSEFDTITVHLGKPPWSLTTYFIRGVLKIAHRLTSVLRFRRASLHRNPVRDNRFPGYRRLLWHVCTARDRFLTYVTARRFAVRGGLVICDRFPQSMIKLMDGPQVARLLGQRKSTGLLGRLAEIEESYYPSIRPPELLIVLKVEPEIAVARKIDEEPGSVRTRSTEIWKLDWENTSAKVVDAGRSKSEVLHELQALIWSELS